MADPLVIANAAGFWGDRNDVLLDQVRGGPIDVVMSDYLAEVTMSILRQQMARDENAGYARDFLDALAPALGDVVEREITVVTNAGGMNPRACGRAVVDMLRRAGHEGVAVGVVTGDDIFGSLDGLLERASLNNLDTGQPLSTVRERVLSANVYLGARPIAEALRAGAQIVVTGRCTDSALALAPLIARFDWREDAWDQLAAGTIAGHVIECGGQASGGNVAGGWDSVPDLPNLGYPIAEVSAEGEVVITKHPGLGGRVTAAVVKEQLLYEIGDPTDYATPDVIADFTSIRIEDLGGDRVRLCDIEGRPAPECLKASISFEDGWNNAVALTFVWPHAIERARATEELLLARCRKLGVHIEAHHVDLVGVSGAHGPMAPAPTDEPPEVLFRMAIRTGDRESASRFAAEVAPLIVSGLPGACGGIATGRPKPIPIVNFWPALVPRDCVEPKVEVLHS